MFVLIKVESIAVICKVYGDESLVIGHSEPNFDYRLHLV